MADTQTLPPKKRIGVCASSRYWCSRYDRLSRTDRRHKASRVYLERPGQMIGKED
ncbi:unnamed protein product [Periconia digitata]|uniref:Uncharacterized protein n=1 Tax=Periconia digitata TaxID=1303443 RepID=A0A9W4XRF9_9PLEO|nr:unnamed protein product [Periconia digitata]